MPFKAGYDAKRYVPTNNGLVAFHTELSSLLRGQSLDAVSFLVNTMNNEKASLKLRVTAAIQILDRGIGKPVDRSVIVTLDSGDTQDPSKLTTDQLESIIAKLDDKQPVIEAEFKDIN
jgi:hypothetical protein